MYAGKDLINVLAEFRGIVQEGLSYCGSPFDRERYLRLQDIVVHLYLELPGVNKLKVTEVFNDDLGLATAKVGVDAAIFDADDRILLHQRTDDHAWGLPGGWVQPHETVEAALVREVFEETGLEVRVVELVSVFSKPASYPDSACASCHILYICESIGGVLTVSHESSNLEFQIVEAVRYWHRNHHQLAMEARAKYSEGQPKGSSAASTLNKTTKPGISAAKQQRRGIS